MMKKLEHIIEEKLKFSDMKTEDGGSYKCFTVSKDLDENGMFVKICSWDESKIHEEFEKFINRKVRITIETIEDMTILEEMILDLERVQAKLIEDLDVPDKVNRVMYERHLAEESMLEKYIKKLEKLWN